MNFLNRAFAQITDLFRTMTPGARIASGLLLAVVIVSVAYLFNHQASSPDQFLMGGTSFAAGQMPAMEAAFAKANLNSYQIEGTRIRIPHGQQTAYMAALADANALPHDFGDFLQRELDNKNPFTPPSVQKQALKVALQRELAQIIGSMRGVERASVLYDEQIEPGGFSREKKVFTASVSVKPAGNEPLDEDRVRMIREVVAGAIAGLSPKNIAVADLNGDVHPAGAGSTAVGNQDPYGVNKRMYENLWEEKIRGALAYIPSVKVNVNVDLNPELDSSHDDVEIDPKPVTLDDMSKSSKQSTQGPASGGGQPGYNAQQRGGGPNSPAAISATNAPHTSAETKDERTRSVASQKTIHITTAPLTPRRVAVAVAVASDYYQSVWLQRNPTPAGPEPKKPDANALAQIETDVTAKIRECVRQLIPLPPTAVQDPTPLVTVTTFDRIPTAPIAAPTIVEQILGWLQQSWSTVGMIGLGMMSLVMLRSTIRSVPASEPARTETASAAMAAEVAEDEEVAPAEVQTVAARLKRRGRSGPSLRDELAEIVHEDPNAAANVLRNWIGSAS